MNSKKADGWSEFGTTNYLDYILFNDKPMLELERTNEFSKLFLSHLSPCARMSANMSQILRSYTHHFHHGETGKLDRVGLL